MFLFIIGYFFIVRRHLITINVNSRSKKEEKNKKKKTIYNNFLCRCWMTTTNDKRDDNIVKSDEQFRCWDMRVYSCAYRVENNMRYFKRNDIATIYFYAFFRLTKVIWSLPYEDFWNQRLIVFETYMNILCIFFFSFRRHISNDSARKCIFQKANRKAIIINSI